MCLWELTFKLSIQISILCLTFCLFLSDGFGQTIAKAKKKAKKKTAKAPQEKTLEAKQTDIQKKKKKESEPSVAKKVGEGVKEVWYDSWEFLDTTQRFISNQWVGLNYNMDVFFSNETASKNQNKSLILAYYGFYKKESESMVNNYDIRVRVHLPNTTKRMRIVIEKERNEILDSSSSEAGGLRNSTNSGNTARNVKDSRYNAGLTYLWNEKSPVKTFVDTGLRILLPLDPFARLRFQSALNTKPVNIFASQNFILFRQDGFSEVTQLSFFRKWTANFQTELINSLVWTDKSDTFRERNNLVFYHQLDPRRSMSYSLGANAALSPTFYYDSYDFSINYRQLLHGNWLFGLFTVGADFPKSADWDMQKFAMARIEVFFR